MTECIICQHPATARIVGYDFCDAHMPSLVAGKGVLVALDVDTLPRDLDVCCHRWKASRIEYDTAPVEHVCDLLIDHTSKHVCPCGAMIEVDAQVN